MKRILEPEYMDTVEEAESYEGMDHSAANQSLAGRFLAIDGGRGLVLDIGTGPGDILVLPTRQVPYSNDGFDGVYSNSILHHIPELTQLSSDRHYTLEVKA